MTDHKVRGLEDPSIQAELHKYTQAINEIQIKYHKTTKEVSNLKKNINIYRKMVENNTKDTSKNVHELVISINQLKERQIQYNNYNKNKSKQSNHILNLSNILQQQIQQVKQDRQSIYNFLSDRNNTHINKLKSNYSFYICYIS